MTLRSMLPLALALVTTPVLAQTVTKPAAVEGGQYAIDPNHTQVLFNVSHMGFTQYFGEFSQASGTLTLSPKTPDSASFSISLPVASITTTSDKLTDELKSDQWLDAGQFPTITFQSVKVAAKGADATITGSLTLHGVTKPITLKAHFVGAGVNPLDKKYTVGFSLSGSFKRSDFGVKTYLPLIGDDVAVTIAAAFERQD